jgi:hypothetical protein
MDSKFQLLLPGRIRENDWTLFLKFCYMHALSQPHCAGQEVSNTLLPEKRRLAVELFFQCPQTKQGFWSAQWSVDRDLRVQQEPGRARQLVGTVRVCCALCGAQHAFEPDELACPLSVGQDQKTT